MKRYRITGTADRQLQEIWRYSHDRWGRVQADAYLARIDAALAAALVTPALLRPRPELGEGVVARGAASHIAYCVVDADILIVIAVLHARMDPRRHLLKDRD